MFSVDIDDKGFTEAVSKAANLSAEDLRPELRKLGTALKREIQSQFMAEVNPWGEPWAPLAARTIRVKQKFGSRTPFSILQESGQLRRSFEVEQTPDGISVYNTRVFPSGVTAEIHQFGGMSPEFGRYIPAREILPFSEDLPITWLSHIEYYIQLGVDRHFK